MSRTFYHPDTNVISCKDFHLPNTKRELQEFLESRGYGVRSRKLTKGQLQRLYIKLRMEEERCLRSITKSCS